MQLDGKTIVQWSPRKHVAFGGASGSMGHLLVQSSSYDPIIECIYLLAVVCHPMAKNTKKTAPVLFFSSFAEAGMGLTLTTKTTTGSVVVR